MISGLGQNLMSKFTECSWLILWFSYNKFIRKQQL